MGNLFGSSSKNTTNAYDYSQTSTVNDSFAGGDAELNNSIIARGSDFSSVDNSLAMSMADNSYNDSSIRTASTDNRDSSNNSLNMDLSGGDFSSRTDNSVSDSSNNSFNLDLSGSDYSQKTTTSNTFSSTDGGAFSMVSGVMGKMIDAISGNQNKLVDMVGLSQKSTLSATNDLMSRSMDAAAVSKSVADIVRDDSGKIKIMAGVAVVAAGLFAVYKFKRGRA
jgi:hypothetical protein